MSDLVGNPEDRFSHVAAHMSMKVKLRYSNMFGHGDLFVM